MFYLERMEVIRTREDHPVNLENVAISADALFVRIIQFRAFQN